MARRPLPLAPWGLVCALLLPAVLFALAAPAPASAWPGRDALRVERERLAERGVEVALTYTGEVFTAVRGGRGRGNRTAYRGKLDLGISLELERLGLWRGGRVVLSAQNGHGKGLSEHRIGDLQTLSNIDADDFTQLSEYWLEQRLLAERARVKLGKQDANVDFCASELASPFVHSSFGLIPTVPLPTFPHPALGLALFLDLRSWGSLGVGLYDARAEEDEWGFRTTFDADAELVSVAEWTFSAATGPGGSLSGRYGAGVWHESGEFASLEDPDGRTLSGNHGFYVFLDQWLLREDAAAREEGLGLFAQLGWAPRDRNEIRLYGGGGLAYRGLLPGRPDDVVGLGVAHARLGGPRRGAAETAIELLYQARLSRALTLQPDLQIVIDPGGSGPNAVVLGLRFELAF